MQAACVMRLDALDKRLAEGSPTFGDTAVIRKPQQKSFEEKGSLGTFLHWSSIVPMGAWVLTSRGDGSEKIDLVSLPANWKRIEERRWKMTRDPESHAAVWVDQDGDVKFAQPGEGTIMSFEERNLPPRGAGPQGAGGHYVPALERFHFGIDENELRLVVPECDAGQEPPELGEGHLPEAVDQVHDENVAVYQDQSGE